MTRRIRPADQTPEVNACLALVAANASSPLTVDLATYQAWTGSYGLVVEVDRDTGIGTVTRATAQNDPAVIRIASVLHETVCDLDGHDLFAAGYPCAKADAVYARVRPA